MKLSSGTASPSNDRKPHRWLRIAVLLTLLAAILYWNRPTLELFFTRHVVGPFGGGAFSDPIAAPFRAKDLASLGRSFVESLRVDASADLPSLFLDLDPGDLRFLEERRREAVDAGVLIRENDDFVPAEIRIGDRTVPVRIRLKGDWMGRDASDRWSLRVHVRKGDPVMGMRRFSLQGPDARKYHAEPMFLDTMRAHDVLAPRYRFVWLWINGDDAGTMALEEHFSAELLESQGRRASVILKLDESELWASRWSGDLRGFHGPFADFTNAEIDVFRSGQIESSPVLARERDAAMALLRGFLEGSLDTDRVFDTERMGRFLAVCELWGAWHAIRWHNLRFAYDPVAARIEPVAFDASTVVALDPGRGRIVADEGIARRLLESDAIRRAYRETLAELVAAVETGGLVERIAIAEATYRSRLLGDFRLLPRFPLERLRVRAETLRALAATDGSFDPRADRDEPRPRADPTAPLRDAYPRLLFAHLIDGGDGLVLELAGAVPEPVEVLAATWVAAGGSTIPILSEAGDRIGSVRLPGKLHHEPTEAVRLRIARPTGWDAATGGQGDARPRLEVVARIAGRDETWTHAARAYVAVADDSPLASTSEVSSNPGRSPDTSAPRVEVPR